MTQTYLYLAIFFSSSFLFLFLSFFPPSEGFVLFCDIVSPNYLCFESAVCTACRGAGVPSFDPINQEFLSRTAHVRKTLRIPSTEALRISRSTLAASLC